MTQIEKIDKTHEIVIDILKDLKSSGIKEYENNKLLKNAKAKKNVFDVNMNEGIFRFVGMFFGLIAAWILHLKHLW